jgi:hypothetical protein
VTRLDHHYRHQYPSPPPISVTSTYLNQHICHRGLSNHDPVTTHVLHRRSQHTQVAHTLLYQQTIPSAMHQSTPFDRNIR